jgi:hypothetical protein
MNTKNELRSSCLPNQWDKKSLTARIKDSACRQRFEAGCPNEVEIEAYAAALPRDCSGDTAVILGMTPELRLLAAKSFAKVLTIDYSRQAIETYTDWLAAPYRQKEIVINGNWLDFPNYLPGQVRVIMGDGIFGNLLDVEQHRILLANIAGSLLPDGYFITRMAVIPDDFNPDEYTALKIIDRFRKGRINETEFGFDTRMLGHYKCCYDQRTFILDNGKLFRECDDFLRAGTISPEELSFIRRYYFAGKNCIIPECLWQELLRQHNFSFTIQGRSGRSWYEYYKIYKCIKLRRF